jgi:hypothetical protein
LFSFREGVIDLNAEVSDGAFDFGVAEQELHGPQIAGSTIDQRCLCSPQRGMAWYWHRVVPLLGSAGHQAIAVDLPGDDRDAGLAAYADIVIHAIAERSDVILVAQSLAGFTAPLVCGRAPVRDARIRECDDPQARRDGW